MFNRTNKLAALLVVAASVASIAPATAAERLVTNDGNITSAIAFDGGYVFDGYKTDDDDTALYYNNGSKDVEVEDYDDYDYDEMVKFGDKYAIVLDGSDEYLLDLSNGTISDDETLEDKEINIASKLKTNLKKADRYGKVTVDNEDLTRIYNNSFGETWYSYAVTPENNADGVDDAFDGKLIGLTTESGKYIDICNVANITVIKSNGKTVKVSEYNEDKDDVTVSLNKAPRVLTQDADNFYVLVEVSIAEEGVDTTQTKTYIQKISKAQGDKTDGAYVPKSVSSYEVDLDGIYDDDDISDAAALFTDAIDADADSNIYNVINGNLLVTVVDNGNVKVSVLKFKKDKPDLKENIGSSSKADVYVAKLDSDDDQDIVGEGVAIDVEGNTWALDKGKIYKFSGTEFKEMFTCDRSIDSLDVYDEKNLIAWDSTGDVYTAISNGSQTEVAEEEETKEDVTTEDTEVKVGWDKNENGTWSFYDASGNQLKAAWTNVGGTWYYLNAEGVMATGWTNVGGTWYFLNASGAMQTGWVNDNGTWYFLNGSGAMQTGWLNDNGTWYYLNASGAMLSNTTVDGYVLGANGAWVK